ncbi:MAG: Shedu anti-phage system protein SduA domain-containing protein [Limisphaerales bacterium]
MGTPLNIKKAVASKVDPLVSNLTLAQVEKDALEFKSILDRNAPEAHVHDFLATHSYFFNGILRMFGCSPLYSKVKLGSDYEVDFAFFDTGSFGPEWSLIEIESPTRSLFTKSGNPSAALTHAIQQVRNWQDWVHDHLEYAKKIMPQIDYPLGHIFMGRRNDLTPLSKKKMRRLLHDHRQILRIRTLDWFVDSARTVVGIMDEGKGRWPVPMHALSHSNLAKGLPPEAQKWLDHQLGDQARRDAENRWKHREENYLAFSEFEK